MQDNVSSEAGAALAEEAGIPVVMNDCIFRFLRNRD
jgi:predicted CoA-binding protein